MSRSPPRRSPRVRVLTRIPSLSKSLRTHPMYLIIPHVANDPSIRLVPPSILLITLPLLGNHPIILRHPANSLAILLLNPSLESRPSLATRVAPPCQSPPSKHTIATARYQGAKFTMLPLLHPTTRNPTNPPPHTPSLTIPRPLYPDPTSVRRVSSLLRRRLTQLRSSSPVFLRQVHLLKPLPRGR